MQCIWSFSGSGCSIVTSALSCSQLTLPRMYHLPTIATDTNMHRFTLSNHHHALHQQPALLPCGIPSPSGKTTTCTPPLQTFSTDGTPAHLDAIHKQIPQPTCRTTPQQLPPTPSSSQTNPTLQHTTRKLQHSTYCIFHQTQCIPA
jgi:hypothetical protein